MNMFLPRRKNLSQNYGTETMNGTEQETIQNSEQEIFYQLRLGKFEACENWEILNGDPVAHERSGNS